MVTAPHEERVLEPENGTTTETSARWKRVRLGTHVLVAVLCVLAVRRTVQALPPLYNWDMLGYMALALEWELDDSEEIHRRTYAAAKAELPRGVYRDLVDPSSAIRAGRAADHAAFTEHIAFYRARVVATLAISLMHRLGAPLAQATWWLSVAAFVLTGILMLVWLGGRAPPWAAWIGATLLLHAPPLVMTATLTTADGLATFLLCTALYLVLERGALRSGAVVATLAIMTRPDTVVLVALFVATLFLLERGRPDRFPPRTLALWLAASVLAYLGVQAHAGEYGWWPVFHISFLQKELHPAALPTSPDWDVYGQVLARQVADLPGVGYFVRGGRFVTGSTFLFVYAGFAVLALALWRRLPTRHALDRHAALLGALLATYFLRWFLFPQLWDRFFAPLYVLVPLVLFSMACRALPSRGDDAQNASNERTPSITSA
jgi:hypothetical protein